jgi:hypothetical protein
MEELHVQLTAFNVVPQRLLFIVANGVVRLRRHGCQRLRQRTRRATPRGFRQVMRHGLQYGEVKTTALTVSNVRVGSVCRFGKQEARPDVPLRAATASEPFRKRLRFMPGKTSLWSCECVSRSAK